MDKIPTMYVRNPSNMALVTEAVTPGCEWVFGAGVLATVKRDGTNVCVAVANGRARELFKRRNPTREEKAAGAEPGYVSASRGDPADKHIFAAIDATDFFDWPDGPHPCEALGPKIQGGIESDRPALYPFLLRPQIIRDLGSVSSRSIRDYLAAHPIEGIVFRAPDGAMCKIKRRDFGIPWPPKESAVHA